MPLILLLLCYLLSSLAARFAYLIRGFGGAVLLRRTAYLIPYWIPLLWWRPLGLWSVSAASLAGGLLLGACLAAFRWAGNWHWFHPATLAMMPRQRPDGAWLYAYSAFGSAASQEFFYRGCCLAVLSPITDPWVAALLSAALFTVEHRIHHWADELFTARDYAFQFAGGLAMAALVILTGSLPAAVMAHIVYNLPGAAHEFLRAYGPQAEPVDLDI